MEDDQIRKYWKSCFKYARWRGSPQESAEDFAQQCWIWTHVYKWKADKDLLYKHFLRSMTGASGGTKFKCVKAIDYRLKNSPGSNEDYLENCVHAEEPERLMHLNSLDERQNIILFLLQAGWRPEELRDLFPEVNYKKELQAIRKAIAESLEGEELFGKAIDSTLKVERTLSQRESEIKRRKKDFRDRPLEIVLCDIEF